MLKSEGDEESSHLTKPLQSKRFRPSQVKEIIKKVLTDRLTGHEYHPENTPSTCREISDEIRNLMKDLDYDRYKYNVQVVMGESKGQGLHFSFKALWDWNIDGFAQESFYNDSLFAVAVVFGTYYYS
ncbi:putative flagellar inner arm dynein light chain [Blattamonas nauphoetae]|uniref:Flagellar inner arm dynein light chain n=1 Tax=Blattamonas nauphoetae TaxID=2049346 RepID=A0ABQ9YFS5_9EUKA|nr:putative flagellar inner arm dynein light chain [Blattamonas nauphoetae]